MSRPDPSTVLRNATHHIAVDCADWRKNRLRRQARADLAGLRIEGRVEEVKGSGVRASLPLAQLGMLCEIECGDGRHLLAEVVGFDEGRVQLSAMDTLDGVAAGAPVRVMARRHLVRTGDWLLGDVVDAYGRSMRGARGALVLDASDPEAAPVLEGAPSPLTRAPIDTALPTGIRCIDGLLTIGEGQRVGIFAGPGCGKTTLLGAIARGTAADVIVFGLIGERGRELQEFLEDTLDEETARRTVVVAATSDRSSLERARAAFTATAIAASFCHQGRRVLLLVDSLTRYGRAAREIGAAAGEPPGRGGYPPSFYASLPRLVERAGNFQRGCVTALYTVLCEQDLDADPVADEVRSLLDGHVVLTRKLAEQGHFPAIDVLASLSRTMGAVVDRTQMAQARWLRSRMTRYADMEFLIRVGEYQRGRVTEDDEAVDLRPHWQNFLQQDIALPPTPLARTREALQQLAGSPA